MKKYFLLISLLILFHACQSEGVKDKDMQVSESYVSPNGLVYKKSKYDADTTMNRLKDFLIKNKKKGFGIALQWSHSDRAKKSKLKLDLRHTELLLFGNPNVGSHFFTSKQTAGVDLPMKALVYQNEKKEVWLIYNDPMYIAVRHGIKNRNKQITMMRNALNGMTSLATGAPKVKMDIQYSASIEGEGLITMRSRFGVKKTKKRMIQLIKKLRKRGLVVALQWSHSKKARASKAKIRLRPTELLLFINPNRCTYLFSSQQTVGIDFPVRVVIWQDNKKRVWVTYNSVQTLADRHQIKDQAEAIKKITAGIERIVNHGIGNK